ncbi:MAG: lysophospholipid acyltransferase family protein [Candidatus Neomarinimicrobiota bacterium]
MIQKLGLRLLIQLERGLLAILFFLNRKVVHGEEYLIRARAADRPIFVGFWHASMIFPLWYLRRYRPVGLVSQSSDGDLIAGLLESWGYSPFRGSSTKGSRKALRIMMRMLDQPGVIMANAMDGPLGPAKVAKEGGLALAARKGAIIIPISGAASRRWTFTQSWDRFQLPKPFGRIVIQFGPPIESDPGIAASDLAQLMGEQLNRLEAEADAYTAHLG